MSELRSFLMGVGCVVLLWASVAGTVEIVEAEPDKPQLVPVELGQ